METPEEEMTIAKIMYLDKPGEAYTVDLDDVRYSEDSMRDRVNFFHDEDFDRSHTYYVKWRTCPASCQIVHKHWAYWPAKILCIAENEAALAEKKFRFPKVPYEERHMSPRSSGGSGSTASSQNSSQDNGEYSDLQPDDYSQDEEDEEDEEEDQQSKVRSSLLRKKQLAEAKKTILKRRSLANLDARNTNRSEGPSGIASNRTHNIDAIVEVLTHDNTGVNANQSDLEPLSNGNNVMPEGSRQGVEADAPLNTVANQNFQAIQGEQGVQVQANALVQQQPAGQGPQLAGEAARPFRRNNRMASYPVVNGMYVISENLSIPVDVYDEMRARSYGNRNMFRRDCIGLCWTDRELAVRGLKVNRIKKNIPDKRPLTPAKIQLVHDMVCHWYEEDKGIVMTQKARDKEMPRVRRCLREVVNVKRALVFPHLVERDRNVENRDNEREA